MSEELNESIIFKKLNNDLKRTFSMCTKQSEQNLYRCMMWDVLLLMDKEKGRKNM